MKPLKTISCFAGIGGFSLAAKILGGFAVEKAIEIDPFRQQVLKKNFPQLEIHGDISTYNARGEDWDLLISTFPCKGMSCAGLGQGYQNKHSGLWWESYRLIEESQPKFVVIENVRNFINKGLEECLDALQLAGYQTEDIEIVSAKEVGAPHLRERLFVVAINVSKVIADSDCFKRGQLPTCWSRQIRGQIEKVRSFTDFANFTDTSSQRHLQAQPQSDCVSREESVAQEAERSDQERARVKSRRPTVLRRESITKGDQLQPDLQGVPDGFSFPMDEYWRFGWWKINPYTDEIATSQRSIRDRQKRISALGDACTPQQAMIPLMRVKYLFNWYQSTSQG